MINIVLFEPEIPFNTANIIRTCVGTNIKLHIIKPIGFDINKDHKDLKRGSTNHLNEVDLKFYDNFSEFENIINTKFLYLLTRYGVKKYSEITYDQKLHKEEEIYVMFGKESAGIPIDILKKYKDNTFRIPTTKQIRSLNLSNCAAIIAFDLVRKSEFEGLEMTEPHKPGI